MIWKTVLAIIGSIGGAGVIISAVVYFCSNIIAKRLEQKYSSKLAKELESFRMKLSGKNYISKVRFDKEFGIYSDLSEKTLDMVSACYFLFPTAIDHVPSEEEQRLFYEKRFQKACDAYNVANTTLMANAPFISEGLYNSFCEIRDLCMKQIDMYTWCGALAPKRQSFSQSVITAEDQSNERTKEIAKKQEQLVVSMRTYLSALDVIEG
ncbi:MAG: hypothetical protein VB021_04685 [Oscillospiraceae bacterium]|nr:hypothetical protein [Oscillospiraceae bacterium]